MKFSHACLIIPFLMFATTHTEQPLDFTDDTFEAFVQRTVKPADADQYQFYYHSIIGKTKVQPQENQTRVQRAFHKYALHHLQEHNIERFKQVVACLDDELLPAEHQQKISTYLMRFGVYLDFQKRRHALKFPDKIEMKPRPAQSAIVAVEKTTGKRAAELSWWEGVTTFVADVKNKVTQFFCVA